jgi:low temperature requirement protein LtrA
VENGENQRRVTTLELFFDLVFVFTITQITHLVEGVRGPSDYGKALLGSNPHLVDVRRLRLADQQS